MNEELRELIREIYEDIPSHCEKDDEVRIAGLINQYVETVTKQGGNIQK